MKAVVFGGSGFVGGHVADALMEAGHQVVIYDVKEYPFLQKKQSMIIGDVLDEKKVWETVKGADFVYNFAGISDIEYGNLHPLETVKRNVLGNTVILEACNKSKIKRFIFASSLYVYSKSGSFYRTSKQASELIIENYHETFGLDYTILRYGSLYGPRADKSNFIYEILKQALTENKITRHGDGEEIREYIHVKDVAKASVQILDEEFKNQNIIISGYQQMKIKDLLLMIKEIMNGKIDIQYLPDVDSCHYEITPYSFMPKIARKLVCGSYLDLGQGILECLANIHKELRA